MRLGVEQVTKLEHSDDYDTTKLEGENVRLERHYVEYSTSEEP
jgi:hypothetical protein